MKAIDINRHFLSKAAWVDPAKTVDRVIIGNPDKDVQTCVVTWISSFQACRDAVDRGADLLMTHEPTFYEHFDKTPDGELEVVKQKRAFIEDNGLVIIRNHDVWDRFPEIGIPWAWAQFLGLGNKPAAIGADGYQHRYDIPAVTLRDLARRVASRTAKLGEPAVQVIGDESQKVSRIGSGTGCGCSVGVYLKMGCDCSIVCDDGTSYWRELQLAEDMGHPVIRVNHGTTEEPGMVTLAQYINAALPGVKATYLPHCPPYRVTAVAGK